MKIAVVSNIYAHGKILQEIGTPIVLAAGDISEIESIDVFTHLRTAEEIEFNKKVRVIPIIDPDKTSSYFHLYKAIVKSNYDRVLINSMPTSQGSKIMPNLLYLLMPIILSRFYRINVSVLYHNSPYLNDVKKLGYSGILDSIKSPAIKLIEGKMFTSCNVYFLLKQYADRIKQINPDGKTDYLRPNGMAGFTTLYLNDKLRLDSLERTYSEQDFSLLIYGSWGPQKDILKALEAVRIIKNSSLRIKVTVAGDVNLHFPSYKEEFERTLSEYSPYIDKRLQYVNEIDLHSLFLNADVIVLPYTTPGGFSGVLSVAILFKLHVVVPEFEEYIEQTQGYDKVHFIPINFEVNDIALAIKRILLNDQFQQKERIIKPRQMFEDFVFEIRKMIA